MSDTRGEAPGGGATIGTTHPGTPVSDPTTRTTRHCSRDAYDRAVDAGIFGPDDRVELIDGQLLE